MTGLSDVSHIIIVYANDTLGNIGESDTAFFTIDTPKGPTVDFFTLVMMLINTTLIVVGIVLFVYFKKCKH